MPAESQYPLPLPRLQVRSNPAPCSHDEVASYWEVHDVITFLVDLGTFRSIPGVLDTPEEERVRRFRSGYFKKRFAISRSILKQVLGPLLKTSPGPGFFSAIQEKGRITLHGRPDIFISRSYSGNLMALTIGKQKIGCDIEVVRRLDIRKIRSCPIFHPMKDGNETEHSHHFLQQWTQVEAFAKLRGIDLYPLVQERFFFHDAFFASYLVDQRCMLSLAADAPLRNHILVAIDQKSWDPDRQIEGPGLIHQEKCGGEVYVRP
jgi:4'-phosphopantetheinyl transferase